MNLVCSNCHSDMILRTPDGQAVKCALCGSYLKDPIKAQLAERVGRIITHGDGLKFARECYMLRKLCRDVYGADLGLYACQDYQERLKAAALGEEIAFDEEKS